MNNAAQLAINTTGQNGAGNGGNFPGNFQGPPPGGFGRGQCGQGGQGGFNGQSGFGGPGFNGGNQGWGNNQGGGNFTPQPYNSNNQFNPDNYMQIYQPNNFEQNPNGPTTNPNFPGMHLPKTALRYAPDYPEQSNFVDDDLDKTLEERLKKL